MVTIKLTETTRKRVQTIIQKLGMTMTELFTWAIDDAEERANKLPVLADSFQPPTVRFEDLRTDFEAGARLRRRAWFDDFYIVQTKHSRFVTLSNGRTSKSWEPYAEDFSGTDWYSLD
jgi:hypothetical protein